MRLDNYVPHHEYFSITENIALERSEAFKKLMSQRRSIRQFSDQHVSNEIIQNAIAAAGQAPSGANKQPWFFGVIRSSEMKQKIREAAENEERAFYNGRASQQWLDHLEPFGTDHDKPYLEKASALIAVFAKTRDSADPDPQHQNYYPMESAGLAAGILLAALHNAGVDTLTHTPSPMRFLNQLLGLEKHYKALMLVICGYAQQPVLVADVVKKPLNEITKTY